MIFTVPLNLHNVSRPRLKSDSLVFAFTALIRIALENCSVVDSKAYFVAFKTVMSIIFRADYSIAYFIFILCSRRSKMVGKEQKIRLENIESRPRVRHFFVVDHFL